MAEETLIIECQYPQDLVRQLAGSEVASELGSEHSEAIATAVYQFLLDVSSEVNELESPGGEPSGYSATLMGRRIQISVGKIALDSVRDFLVLAVVLSSLRAEADGIPAAVLGAAIASFVRSTLGNIHRANEHLGERCVLKMIMEIQAEHESRAAGEADIVRAIEDGRCVLSKCQYRKGDDCALRQDELRMLLGRMESTGRLLTVGATSYRVPW